MESDPFLRKMLNAGLRGLSLAAKLILTLYMGRYLGLSDLGVYGLVFSVVNIAVAVLGVRLDYVVTRDIVGATELEVTRAMRDQAVFYGMNYLFFTLVMAFAWWIEAASPVILGAIYIITIFENMSGAMTANLVALGHPLLSTMLFFLRSGLWSIAVVMLGFFVPSFRSVETVLCFWAAGEVISVGINLWVWRRFPWRQAMVLPVDWQKVTYAMRTCVPTWLGTIGAMLALSVDRFVVSFYLDLEQVGIITFYSSFAFALLSMVQSGFFAFSYPRMICYFRNRDREAFIHEMKKTGMEAALFVAIAGAVIGVLIPWMGPYLNKPELTAASYTLWLLIIAVWLRANADTLYYALYAQEKDKTLWLGTILFLIPSAFCNVLFVPWAGLPGAGYSAIVAALFLLAWRIWFVIGPDRKIIF